MIKHIAFDMDDTLYRKTREVRSAVMEYVYAKISSDREIEIDVVKDKYAGAYSKLGTNTKVLGEFGYARIDALNLINSFPIAPHIAPDPALVNMVRLLREKYGINVLTNNNKIGLEEILARLGFLQTDFDFLLHADNTREPKPSPMAYRQLVELAKCEPREILFVGDRLHADLVPAKSTGMKTMLVWSPMPMTLEHKPITNIDVVVPCIHSVIDYLSFFGPDAK